MPRAYIIAEIGTAHGGDPAKANDLIDAATESGADCAKFQCVIANEIVHRACGAIDLPGRKVDIFSRFKALEQPRAFYEGLKEACETRGVDFLCTTFGPESAKLIESIGPSAHKVASPELNHHELIRLLSSYGKPLYMSTGVSTMSDIERAIEAASTCPVRLMHCVTAYPAPEEEYNLRLIPLLARLFGVPVGLSDHSQDPSLVPGLATALGATVVEKHFTLDRRASGLDDPIAMDPTMFTEMAATIRRVSALLETGEAGPDAEIRAVREFEAEYGTPRVARVLGTGQKRLAPAEAGYYHTTRRSLLAVQNVPAGTPLSPSHLAALRAETLAPGLEPSLLPILTGAVLQKPVSDGEGLRWDHLLPRERE
ncbi:MAG: N-acetylneuraminate synthase family protein [Spirochaetales bacterium]